MAKWGRRSLLALIVLVGIAAALEIYARTPAVFDVRPIGSPAAAPHLVLIFHGRGGADDPVIGELASRFEALAGGRNDVAVLRYVWSPHSDTRFRAAVNGTRVGEVLGAELARLPELKSLHLVGHSAGAYPLDPLCEALRAAGRTDVRVDMTFLDPIGFAGMIDTGHGARNFGACADFAEAYINTDDPVPATSVPLRHAWNVDVTQSAERAGFGGDGHRWPVRYYLDHLDATVLDQARRGHDSEPRGAVTFGAAN